MGRGRESVIWRSQGMILACISLIGGLGSGRGRDGWAESANVYINKWSSFVSASTPSFYEWCGSERTANHLLTSLTGGSRWCVCMCKISKYVKTGSILWNTALAKHNTCSECLRKQSQLGQCCPAQILCTRPRYTWALWSLGDASYWCGLESWRLTPSVLKS